MDEPVRPGLRLGVEQEGAHAGQPTLVILGDVKWSRIAEALSRHKVAHVFWEVADGQRPWRLVRRLFDRPVSKGKAVTLEVSDPSVVPKDLLPRVELVGRLPSAWARVDTLKINFGGFHVAYNVLRSWRMTEPKDYKGDVQLWP